MVLNTYPSQLDICLSLQCNLKCSYCFVRKNSSHKLHFADLRLAIKDFLSFPPANKIIAFSYTEPLLHYRILKQAIKYARDISRRTKVNLQIRVSTNGILLSPRIYEFMAENNVFINLSLDGEKVFHDKHRVFFANRRSTYELINRRFSALNKKNTCVYLTFMPVNTKDLFSNIKHIIYLGFKIFNFYPDFFSIWDKKQLKDLSIQLKQFSEFYVNYVSDKKLPLRWGPLNKHKNGVLCNKILFGNDAKFYYCDKVLNLATREKKEFCIGHIKSGPNLSLRQKEMSALYKEFLSITDRRCLSCGHRGKCFCPLGLYIYCKTTKKYFIPYFDSFCKISEIYINTIDNIKYRLHT